MSRFAWLFLLVAATAFAGEIEEPSSKTKFPDRVVLSNGDSEIELRATGAGLRKKLWFKAYAAVSYVDASANLGDDPARSLIELDAARQLHLIPLRDFGADKVVDAFREGFENNDPELAAELAEDVERWLGFFTRDPREGDDIRMQYVPGVGTSASHNDEMLGTIENPRFAQLVWGIYFGDKPVNGDLKHGMLSVVSAE